MFFSKYAEVLDMIMLISYVTVKIKSGVPHVKETPDFIFLQVMITS